MLSVFAPLLELCRCPLVLPALAGNVIADEVTAPVAEILDLLLDSLQPFGAGIFVLQGFKLVPQVVDLIS